MDTFLKEIYLAVIFKWIYYNNRSNKDGIRIDIVEDTGHYHTVRFIQQDLIGLVTIWSNGIIEEQITTLPNKELIFYLHYQFISLNHFINLFTEFYRTMISHSHYEKKRIGLACSGGLSTSLLASMIQEVLKLEDEDYDVRSMAVTQIQEEFDYLDAIYLAPQVSYMQASLLQETNHRVPIYRMDPTVYATKDFQAMIKKIKTDINEQKGA